MKFHSLAEHFASPFIHSFIRIQYGSIQYNVTLMEFNYNRETVIQSNNNQLSSALSTEQPSSSSDWILPQESLPGETDDLTIKKQEEEEKEEEESPGH